MFRKAAARRVVPALETLEDRLVPARVFSTSGGVLNIVTDARDDDIFILDQGNGAMSATVKGIGSAGNVGITRIQVSSGGGKDRVRYLQQQNRTVPLSMSVYLGSGNDTFFGELRGGIQNFQTMQIAVEGNSGRDNIEIAASNLFGNSVDVQGLALLQVELNGGSDDDTIRINYGGKADGELRFNARGGANNDTVDVQVTAAPGSEGRLGAVGQQATVEGNSGNDILTFRVRNQTSPGFEVFAQIDGGSNSTLALRRDEGRHTANVTAVRLERAQIVT